MQRTNDLNNKNSYNFVVVVVKSCKGQIMT